MILREVRIARKKFVGDLSQAIQACIEEFGEYPAVMSTASPSSPEWMGEVFAKAKAKSIFSEWLDNCLK